MKRGDLVSVALPGDYRKPRPALVLQSDIFEHVHSVSVLPLTTDVVDAPDSRIEIFPTDDNGLLSISYVMIDKTSTIRRSRVGYVIGRVTDDEMTAVTRAFARFFDVA
jgi:mRNA interferase MazF